MSGDENLSANSEYEEEEEESHYNATQSFCFSQISDCKNLVCDWQGVWNELDGFTLTDPVIHSLNFVNKQGERCHRQGTEGSRKLL